MSVREEELTCRPVRLLHHVLEVGLGVRLVGSTRNSYIEYLREIRAVSVSTAWWPQPCMPK